MGERPLEQESVDGRRPVVLEYATPEKVDRLALAGVILGWISLACIPLLYVGIGVLELPLAMLSLWPSTAILAIALGLRKSEGKSPEAAHRVGRALLLGGISMTSMILYLIVLGTRPRVFSDPPPPCITYVNQLSFTIDTFQVDCGRFPTNAEGLGALSVDPGIAGWKGPYLQRPMTDPWGRPFIYACPGRHNPQTYDLFSAGPDGKPGTADDVGNWQD